MNPASDCGSATSRGDLRHNVNETILNKIRSRVRGTLLEGEPLSNHTTYRVGGSAELLVCPDDIEGAEWLYRFARREGMPLAVIGAGSNVIAPDDGVEGIVLKIRRGRGGIEFDGGNRVRAEAGVDLTDLARAAAAEGLGGISALAGIPGTVGGAVWMNAGAGDVETADLLGSVEVVTSEGRRRRLARDDITFGYRHSLFQENDWLIVGAEFELPRGDRPEIERAMERLVAERNSKYPMEYPNAGSVFKRPAGDYAGRLIEAAGCKGLRVGDAAVSERHANFIVNLGSAGSAEILELIALVRERVRDRTGVELELEQIRLPRSV
jgi:UDP-N-acetylmuramate dehydrogenase